MSISIIDCVFFDIDGVLTNGSVLIDEKGHETKSISFVDIDAIFRLKKQGIKLGFITGEDNAFSEYVNNRFTPDFFLSGCKDKLAAYKALEQAQLVDPKTTCFAGDSRKDITLLEYVNYGFAPSTSEQVVKDAAFKVIEKPTGGGFVNEIINHVISQKPSDLWDSRLSTHLHLFKTLRSDKKCRAAVESTCSLMISAFKKSKKLLICGNGGSAADAQHIAGELVGRFYKDRPALPAEALTVDSSVLTCIANDYSFDEVFSRQVEGKGTTGDVLLAISTSGNSSNIIKAVEAAQRKQMKVIGLLGDFKESPLAKNADVAICIPSIQTPRIQEAHLFIIHLICEQIEQSLFGEN